MRRGLIVISLIVIALACKKEGRYATDTASTEGTAPVSAAASREGEPPPYELPFEVADPESGHKGFAEFGWQEFIALNWPAADGAGGVPQRGVPDKASNLSDRTRMRVWETWKADWELVGFAGSPKPVPTPWSEWTPPPGVDPCEALALADTTKMIIMGTKMDPVRGINQALAGPLIDQKRNYVRYEIRMNQNEYETSKDKGWNIAATLPAVISFDASVPGKYGAIEIKAAWRELPNDVDASTFYWQKGYVVEPKQGGGASCRETRLGLIGFHIAHKTKNFPQWVWTTFEHVNNVPEGAPAAGVQYSLNNGTSTPATTDGFCWPNPPNTCSKPPKLAVNTPFPPQNDPLRTPVQTTRFRPIDAQIAAVNARVRGSSTVKGTVFENYMIVAQQWPTDPASFKLPPDGTYPVGAGRPFPVDGPSNTTMETYFQNKTGFLGSCMGCHYGAAKRDFSWLIQNFAWKPASAREAAEPMETDRLRDSLAPLFQSQ